MNRALEGMLSHAPVLTDGALGTQLQTRGLSPGECPDLWNLDRPVEVESVIRSYVDAGSEIILTATFRANRLALAPYGTAANVEQINLAAVEVARRAAGDRAKIFGSLGPSGRMLAVGEVSEGEISLAFAEQARVLTVAGVDGFVIETMADLAEARLAVAAVREFGLPVVASMVFDSGRNKDRTMTGVTPEQATQELAEAGADVIGANCGTGIAGYVAVCQRIHAATDRPVWIKPNAGVPEMIEGESRYQTTPEVFAGFVPALLQAGATFVGGCCGTTPEFIRALNETLRRWGRR